MTRKSTLAVIFAALLAPATAGALGLGNIQASSALNEPLQARIPIRGASSEDFGNLRARLGSQQQFDRAGFDRPFILTKLRFKVVETGDSNGFIQVSSKGPIAEPFLNFLLDVTWLSGHVVREYTLLLDPPVYGAAISSTTKKQVTTIAAIPAAGTSPAAAAKQPAAKVSPPASLGSTAASGGSYGPVKSGETLWSIATAVRPSSAVSIQAMMLAILKANPEAFIIDNVNALRTGSVLRIPAASELRQGKAEALAAVARQHSLWREYRQSIGAPVAEPAASVQAAAPSATGSAPTAAAATSAAGGGDSGELKLVGGTSQGSGSGSGSSEELQALRDELSMAREQADAAKNENQELQDRLSKVEGIVTDLNRLVDLKEEQLAALQAQLAKSQAQAPAQPQPVPAPKAEPKAEAQPPAPKPAEPKQAAPAQKKQPKPAGKPKIKRPPPPPPQPTTVMDMINDMLPVPLWMVLAGLGVLLVGAGGFSFMRRRRTADASGAAVAAADSVDFHEDKTEVPDSGSIDSDLLDAEAVTEVPDVPAAASLGSEDLTEVAGAADSAATEATELPAEKAESTGKMEAMESASPDDDPLAEFNVYLAYESFDQAEQLARNAIASAPERHDYKAKLLEVFYASKNIPAYETAARELQDAVGEDHEYMVQARDWWSDLGTGRELFAADDSAGTDTASEADVFDVTATDAGAGEETGLDFDLGAAAESTDSGEDADSSLDFDLGSLGDSGAVAAAGVAGVAGGGTGLDFDLGGLDEGESETAGAQSEASSLDFDLGGLDEAPAGDTTTAAAADAGDIDDGTGLDFDLGGMDEAITEVPGEETGAAEDDSGLDFDLGGLDDTSEASAAAEPEAEADGGLDFDLGETGSETAVTAVADAVTEVNDDLGLELDAGLDLDSSGGDEAPAAAAEAADDLDLDFDLGETMTTAAAAQEPDSGLDMDLEATGEEAGTATAAAGDEADETGLDLGLDMDLESTGTVPGAETADAGEAADLGLDMDLEATGGEAEAGTVESGEAGLDLGLDMDLEATGGEAETGTVESGEAGLDLGLDMDLEATGGEAGTEESGEAGLDLGLDMDLEASGGEAEAGTGESEEAGLDLGLDMDLEASGGEADAAGQEPQPEAPESADGGLDLSLDLDLDAAAEDAAAAEGASTDTELPDLSLAADETDFQDAATEVADITDQAQMEDLGIEIPGQDQATSIDTVKLAAEDVSKLSLGQSTDLDIGLEAGDEDAEVGVDTEFRGIFPMDSGAEDGTAEESSVDFDLGAETPDAGIGAGTSSSVDFDLGADFESTDADSALADAIEDSGDEAVAQEDEEIDLDVTVFSLPDLPGKPKSGDSQAEAAEADEDEDEDKTLVLGRSAATGAVDDMQTKLDLAQAYMETGDTEGARNLLGEVMAEGDEHQQATAREMLTKLS